MEFEALGEQSILKNVKQSSAYNEAKREAAFRWLSEQAQLRDRRGARTAQLAWGALFSINGGSTHRHNGRVDSAPLNAAATVNRGDGSPASHCNAQFRVDGKPQRTPRHRSV